MHFANHILHVEYVHKYVTYRSTVLVASVLNCFAPSVPASAELLHGAKGTIRDIKKLVKCGTALDSMDKLALSLDFSNGSTVHMS